MIEVLDVARGSRLLGASRILGVGRRGAMGAGGLVLLRRKSQGERIVIDPLAPPASGARGVGDRLDAAPPAVASGPEADHVRDVDLFARWFGARGYGPFLFWGRRRTE